MPKPHMVALRVIESSLPGEGVAQLPQHVFGALQMHHGSRIEVISVKDESLVVKALPDPIHTEDGIRMRRTDLQRLGVRDGEGVAIQKSRRREK
ncbi:MAG TPA: hypothetical protein VI893_09355 [Thermoplasmata archaeon]|nr:hypothetical protein [Thermoplasmata archaeon]